jgi:hypothetical protein
VKSVKNKRLFSALLAHILLHLKKIAAKNFQKFLNLIMSVVLASKKIRKDFQM